MNYELAKQLKNAGFPNIRVDEFFEHRAGSHSDDYGGDSDYSCYCNKDKFPTLSELIKACGNGFAMLLRDGEGLFTAFSEINWGLSPDGIEAEGKTPEESVARLWLALNKKPNA